ncbi:uncharacterized protein LOC119097311 [Pollicipes pollicipes]|uniref:uncharacterized protein LOC119097311 n=1 Tax=Pollicipes pollicipes TaxID=41117 RepID=UPI00188567A0|nr:uncharacterized protein LOC119097311 [Pollicipes pollicipes]
MDGLSCMKSFESNSTLLAGYRPLDSSGDDEELMRVSSSDDGSEDSDLDSTSDSESGRSPSVVRPMNDSLDLHPLLGSPRRLVASSAAVSRHVPTWVMRTKLDDSNANALPATLTATMPRPPTALTGLSPLSPAIEKAEIERSEKPAEINGNLVLYKDGARPKVVDKVKTSRHTAGAVKSPKHRRAAAAAAADDEGERRDVRVHFSNDACVPKKQEKMMMNTSLKMGLESPRRPSRPTSLSVASRQVASRPAPAERGHECAVALARGEANMAARAHRARRQSEQVTRR